MLLEAKVSYESTWFSKERMMGYLEVLKALSAIASITSYHRNELGVIRKQMALCVHKMYSKIRFSINLQVESLFGQSMYEIQPDCTKGTVKHRGVKF